MNKKKIKHMISVRWVAVYGLLFVCCAHMIASAFREDLSSQQPIHACWRILDTVKDALVGEEWRDLGVDFSTQAGFDCLMHKARERLDKHGKKAPQMVEALRDKFQQYLWDRRLIEGGWLQRTQDLEDVAKNLFPGDTIMQANAVLHMMVYYMKCVDLGLFGMFARSQKPTDEISFWAMYFMDKKSEVMSVEAAEIGHRLLYLLQDKYEFTLLDFVVSMEKMLELAVIPKDWSKQWQAHQGRLSGLFDLLVAHDWVHGRNTEYLLAIMNGLDGHFKEYSPLVIQSVLRRVWETKGPAALVGFFFVFHEILGVIIDVQGDILFRKISSREKIERILEAGAQRKVFDEGIYDLVRGIQITAQEDRDLDQTLKMMTMDCVAEFMMDYPWFYGDRSVDPYEEVKKEWLDGESGDHLLLKILQSVCDYVCAQDPSFDSVSIVKGGLYDDHMMLLTSEEVFFFQKVIGGITVTFIPTKKVVNSYTLLQKKQMLSAFKVFNVMQMADAFQRTLRIKGLTTRRVFGELSDIVKKQIFGDMKNWDKIAQREGIAELWEHEMAKNDKWTLTQARKVMIEAMGVYGAKRHKKVHTFSVKLVRAYGEELGSLATIVLGDAYIQAIKEKSISDQGLGFLEDERFLTQEAFERVALKGGVPLMDQLRAWMPDIQDYVFMCSPPTLFARVVMASENKRPIVMMCWGRENGVSVYDRCADIHQRKINEGTWDMQGISFVHVLRMSFKQLMMDVWEQSGVFCLIGFDLFLDSVVCHNMPVGCFSKKLRDFIYYVIGDVSAMKPKKNSIIQGMQELMKGHQETEDWLLQKEMMYFVISLFFA